MSTVEEARINWLPQFINHYRNLGVEAFHVSIHFEADIPKHQIVETTARSEKLLDGCGVALSAVLVCPYDAMTTRAHHDHLQAQVPSRDDWIVWADIDEFQLWPGEIKSLLLHASRERLDYFRGEVIDRVSEDGTLTEFDPSESLWSQFPRKCHLTRDVASAPTRKVACSRAPIKITPGNHYAVDESVLNCSEQIIEVHHFKWDASVVTRLRRRLQPEWRDRCPWWTESKRLLDHIEFQNGAVVPPQGNDDA
ncbi:MAG: hypothetical protein ABSG25_09450 [Bryobacteraceae bacterium]